MVRSKVVALGEPRSVDPAPIAVLGRCGRERAVDEMEGQQGKKWGTVNISAHERRREVLKTPACLGNRDASAGMPSANFRAQAGAGTSRKRRRTETVYRPLPAGETLPGNVEAYDPTANAVETPPRP